MVYLAPLIGAAALLSNMAMAIPRPVPGSDNQSNESNSSESNSSQSSSFESSSFESSSFSDNFSSSAERFATESSDSSYTTTAYNSYQTSSYEQPSYGSGSSQYNNYGSGYDDCVQQCIADYGNSAYQYNPTPTEGGSYDGSYDSSGSDGGDQGSEGTNGVTHTVIVAPTAGTLRYMPFAVNASVGDTVEFRWGADGHTVSHSSELLPCNKTADSPFTSGLQKAGFVYHQAVTSLNTTYFYCAAPTHCQKGMFGIINPPANLDAPTSVGSMMQDLMARNDDLKTYANITTNNIGDTGPGATWGSSIDIGKLEPDMQEMAAFNILYTRNVLAMNGDNIWKNNAIDLSGMNNGTGVMFPPDIASALQQSNVALPSNNAATTAGATDAAPPAQSTDAAPSAPPASGASSMASPKMLVAFVAVVATFFAL